MLFSIPDPGQRFLTSVIARVDCIAVTPTTPPSVGARLAGWLRFGNVAPAPDSSSRSTSLRSSMILSTLEGYAQSHRRGYQGPGQLSLVGATMRRRMTTKQCLPTRDPMLTRVLLQKFSCRRIIRQEKMSLYVVRRAEGTVRGHSRHGRTRSRASNNRLGLSYASLELVNFAARRYWLQHRCNLSVVGAWQASKWEPPPRQGADRGVTRYRKRGKSCRTYFQKLTDVLTTSGCVLAPLCKC